MIEVQHLTKRFGDVTAVNDLSFTVAAGEVFGLLGPNGAGKTTTLRMLATLITPDSGTATIAGHSLGAHPQELRRAIGVVNGGMGLYDRLTGREVLTYFGQLYGMKPRDISTRIAELDEYLHLGDTLTRPTAEYSTGMKQKIVIARAVLHNPRVIFFDEATAGLDVVARRAVIDFVRKYPSDGRAVIYSTHVMSEVEELCDRVALIFDGAKQAEGTVQNVQERVGASSFEEAFFRIAAQSGIGAA